MNKIYILGIGPGSRDYLLNITEKKVKEADVLIGGRRALKLFGNVDKEKIKITADLEKIKNYIDNNYQSKKIAVLVSGDPGLYSLLNYLKQHFPTDKLEVIPGISAIQLAFARAKMVWQDAKIISLHGTDNKEHLLNLVAENRKVGFFTDYKFPPNLIAEYLLANGVQNKRGIVFTELSYDSEEIVDEKLQQLSKMSFKKLNVMVIYNEKMEV